MSKIALGTVQFGVNYGINSIGGKVKSSEAVDILNYAYSKNISLLDTAPSYGNSEKVLGDANINNFEIITKTRYFNQSIISDKEATHLINDFNQSLQSLKQKSIYCLMVHNADDLLKPGADIIINQLNILKQQKLISKIGVSIYTEYQLQKIINRFDVDIVQLPFNILDRRLINSGILNKIYSQGIEVHARSIFLQGLLLMDHKEAVSKFNRWSKLWGVWHQWLNDYNITALEATIRYATSVPEISKVLVGVDTKNQLKEIVNASIGYIPIIPKELFIDDPDLLNPSNWEKL